MKRIAFFAVCAGAIALSAAMADEVGRTAPQIPREAMPFGIQTGPGKYTWLSEYEGKTCVVAFILTTCPHCQFTTGVLNKLAPEFAGRGVQIIESAAEPMAALHIPAFKAQFHPAFPVGYNDERYIAKFLGLPEDAPMFFPVIAILDRRGIIRAQIAGDDPRMAENVQEKSLREAIGKALAEGGQAPHRTPAPK